MPAQAPVFAGQPAGDVPAVSGSLADARRGFQTKLIRRESTGQPVTPPPPQVFGPVRHNSPAGSLAAYLSPDPGDGRKHPAIIWITGGDCATIDDVWKPSPPANDQSACAFRKAGIVMMFPSLRGGNDNPGRREGFFGEVDDVLAATDYLARQPYVDPKRIYLGGHSTGGTLALLTSCSSDRSPAVRLLRSGPIEDVRNYGPAAALRRHLRPPRGHPSRSPIHWLGSIRSPTFVIEGTGGNYRSLMALSQVSRNPQVQFFPVNGANHFNVLSPATQLLAQKVAADDASSPGITLQKAELDGVVGR